MKKLMLLTSTLVAGLAFAGSVSSTQTFGVLKVASDLEQTVISVPWVAAGDINTAVKVRDFVKTTGMTDGDKLYLYNTTGDYKGKFSVWVLSGGAWVAPNSVSKFGGLDEVKDADATIAQGSALVVVRSNPTGDDIYLYGQYKDASELEYAITRSNGAALISPVNTSGAAINLNSGVTWDIDNPPRHGDLIKLHKVSTAGGTAPIYRYNTDRTDDRWGRFVAGNWEEAVVLPGMGFWYTPVNDSGTTKFTVK